MDTRSGQPHVETPIIATIDLDEEMRELAELARLEDDWDSFASKPIAQAAINDAKTLVMRAAVQYRIRPYSIAPLSGSGVQLEWRGTNHRLEVEVYGNGRCNNLLIKGSGANRRAFETHDASLSDVLDTLSVVVAE